MVRQCAAIDSAVANPENVMARIDLLHYTIITQRP
jgi:hypothetical protein